MLQFVKRMSYMPIIVLNYTRVLVLTDCKTQFDDNQPTDYLITKNNVEYLGDLDLGVRPMTRGVDYDAIIIHEMNHFVYAMP